MTPERIFTSKPLSLEQKTDSKANLRCFFVCLFGANQREVKFRGMSGRKWSSSF